MADTSTPRDPNTTERLGLEQPNVTHFLSEDVERLRNTIEKISEEVATIDPATNKLDTAQIPDNVATWDDKKVIAASHLPGSVVQKDSNGKIPLANIPQGALTTKFEVAGQAAMLALTGLALGDIAHRTDLNAYFMLLDTPASNINSWKRLHEDAFYNQFASKTDPLAGIDGPVMLRVQGTDPYAAATVGQVNQVAAIAGGGANMSGVMNNFIGAVEWLNAPRTARLPVGYLAADGQVLKRADYPLLWYAISQGLLECTATDALWLDSGVPNNANNPSNSAQFRSKFSPGDGTLTTGTTFRMPDLNGAFPGDAKSIASIKGLFLRGDHGSAADAFKHEVRDSAAPNIVGGFTTIVPGNHGTYRTGAFGASNGSSPNQTAQTNAPDAAYSVTKSSSNTTNFTDTYKYGFVLNASTSSPIYGRADEIRPASATGIWIIRATGAFESAQTSFKVIAADSTRPADGTQGRAGEVHTEYWIGDKCDTRGFMRADNVLGTGTGRGRRLRLGILANGATDPETGPYNSIDINGDGSLTVRALTSSQGFWTNDVYVGMSARPTVTGQSYQAEVSMTGNVEAKGFDHFVHHKKPDGSPMFDLHWSHGVLQPSGDVSFETLGHTLTCTNGTDAKFTRTWQFTNSGYLYAPSIGTGARSAPLIFDDITSSHSITYSKLYALANPSDLKLKRSIHDYNGLQSLQNIEAMRLRTFIFKDDPTGRIRRGVIAQEIQKIDEGYVSDMDGTLTLDTSQLLADALAAIKVLSSRVKALEARL